VEVLDLDAGEGFRPAMYTRAGGIFLVSGVLAGLQVDLNRVF
jgi:hypothetical protein